MDGLHRAILLAYVACLWMGQGSFAVFSPPVCNAMRDPFEEMTFNKIDTADDCLKKCSEETNFQCRSVLYSDKKRQCILSKDLRSEPLLSSGGSKFKYYERIPCDVTDLTSRISLCTATSQYSASYKCDYAYEGSNGAAVAGTEWAVPVGKGVGESMKANLDNDYTLTSIWIRHRCHQVAQVSGWDIETATGEVVKVTRTCGGTNGWADCTGEGNDWVIVNLPTGTRTSWVKFTMTAVCDTQAPGIREIRLMGYPNPGLTDLISRIESCIASSEYSSAYNCEYAYEGSEGSASGGTEWAMKNGEGSGGWIKVYLDKTYTLSVIGIRHRCHRVAQVSGWQIQTDSGSDMTVSRDCGGTNSWTDCSGDSNDWFMVPLPTGTRASWIKFTMTNVCGTSSLGIRELKILGYDD